MRAALDKLYLGAGYAAGIFMVLILLAVLAGIFGRMLRIDTPGMDAYAGYSMAASSFLALAHTLRRGEHIRVTLLLEQLGARTHRVLDIAAHAIALCLTAALAWFSARLVWQSYLFHDVSQGLDATPLWIPQIAMAAGALLLLIAVAQNLVELLLNVRRPAPAPPLPLE